MGICVSGKPEEVSNLFLLTQCDHDAKRIAEELMEDVQVFHSIRNMCGYTGTYRGVRVSLQGLGIGNVSASIYVTELEKEFTPACFVKVDGCTALQAHLQPGDLVLAQTVYSTSAINRRQFRNRVFPAAADFDLLYQASQRAEDAGWNVHVGPVVSIETRSEWPVAQKFARFGALALDLEMNQVYTVANREETPVLGLLRVFENHETGACYTEEQCCATYMELARFALDLLIVQDATVRPKRTTRVDPRTENLFCENK